MTPREFDARAEAEKVAGRLMRSVSSEYHNERDWADAIQVYGDIRVLAYRASTPAPEGPRGDVLAVECPLEDCEHRAGQPCTSGHLDGLVHVARVRAAQQAAARVPGEER